MLLWPVNFQKKKLQVIDEHTLKLEQAAITVAPVFKQMQATPNGSSDIDMDNVNLNDSASPQKTTDVVRGRQFGKIILYISLIWNCEKSLASALHLKQT